VLPAEFIRQSTSEEFDLHRQPEHVRIVWQPMLPDEMSKLWTLFSQTPYRHSEVYVVTPVLIDSVHRKPIAPPVLSRGEVQSNGHDQGVFVDPSLEPAIAEILYRDIRDHVPSFPSATTGDEISLRGQRLNRAVAVVLLTDGDETPREVARYVPEKLGDRYLIVKLDPVPTWVSGRLLLAVAYLSARGKEAFSAKVPIELAPEILVSASGVSAFAHEENGRQILIVNLAHPVRTGGDPKLILSALGDQAAPAPLRTKADSSHATPTSLVFDVTDVAPGRYRLSMLVDGIESRFVKRRGTAFEFDERLEFVL
jgi:hypothetical protein